MDELILVGKRKREFTPRMKEIMNLSRPGVKNKEIAEQLGVSVNNINVMKTKINKRLRLQKGLAKLK
ncbi:MAG: LuxR C-terminal-related transcriptional regulator [Ignavibacteriales bacterium]|nr:LuxR C-terminal-related transcriptional regulator [Ignavibacteriales bacterium]